eukprot:m51a1_g2256 putative exportin T (1022) ;mRNA; f:316243-320269
MSGMDEFERAVAVACDAQAPAETRQAATAYLEAARDQPGAWRYCLSHVYAPAGPEQLKFVCLHVLQGVVNSSRMDQMEAAEKAELLTTLVNWGITYLPANQSESISVKNKYAQVVVQAMKRNPQGPAAWPTFFDSFLGASMQYEAVLDALLRILVSFHEEIVDSQRSQGPDAALCTQIKDVLRERTTDQLAELWYATMTTFALSKPALASAALRCVRLYIEWINLKLIANERYLALFYKFLEHAAFREDACECLYEVMTKGMDNCAKVDLVLQLRPDAVAAQPACQDSDYLSAVGKLVSTAALALLSCCEKMQTAEAGTQEALKYAEAARSLSDSLLPLSFAYFSRLNWDESCNIALLQVIHTFISKFKATFVRGEPPSVQHVQVLLPAILSKARQTSPSAIAMRGIDDDEIDALEEFRRQLFAVFRLIVRMSQDHATAFVQGILDALCAAPIASVPADEAEAVLSLFHTMGESVFTASPSSPTPAARAMVTSSDGPVAMPSTIDAFFQRALLQIASSSIPSHPHPSVSLVYFEILVRYAKHMPTNVPAALTTTISTIIDHRHARNACAKACHIFQRFARVMRSQMGPYASDIYASVAPILSIGGVAAGAEAERPQLAVEDQLNIYESLGFIAGSARASSQPGFARALSEPLVAQIGVLVAQAPYRSQPADRAALSSALCSIVTALTLFSKGFVLPVSGNDVEAHNATAACFATALTEAFGALSAMPEDAQLREKCIALLHRMIEGLGDQRSLPLIPGVLRQLTSLALAPGDQHVRALNEMLVLAPQIAGKFRENAQAVLGEVVPAILGSTNEAMAALMAAGPSGPSGPSGAIGEEMRELTELLKTLVSCINTLVTTGLARVLVCHQMQTTIGCVIYGITALDYGSRKVCVKCLERLMETWGGQPDGAGVPGFEQYTVQNIIPVVMRAAIEVAPFASTDAGASSMLTECVRTLLTAAARCSGGQPASFAQYVHDNVLLDPLVGCPPQAAQAFAQTLVLADQKALVNATKAVAEAIKQKHVR